MEAGFLTHTSPGNLHLNLESPSLLCPLPELSLEFYFLTTLSNSSEVIPPSLTSLGLLSEQVIQTLSSHGYPHKNDRYAVIDWEQMMGGGGSYTCIYSRITPHSKSYHFQTGASEKVWDGSTIPFPKWWILSGRILEGGVMSIHQTLLSLPWPTSKAEIRVIQPLKRSFFVWGFSSMLVRYVPITGNIFRIYLSSPDISKSMRFPAVIYSDKSCYQVEVWSNTPWT